MLAIPQRTFLLAALTGADYDRCKIHADTAPDLVPRPKPWREKGNSGVRARQLQIRRRLAQASWTRTLSSVQCDSLQRFTDAVRQPRHRAKLADPGRRCRGSEA